MLESNFAAGRPIALQGEAADCFYVLKSGAVEIVVNEAKDLPLDERKLARGGKVLAVVGEPGGIIGEMGVVLGTRAASLRAGPAGAVLDVVPATDESLGRAIETCPSLGVRLARVLARRLSERTAELDGLSAAVDSAAERLARAARRFVEFGRQIERVFAGRPEVLFLARTIEGTKTFGRAGAHPAHHGRVRVETATRSTGSAVPSPEGVGQTRGLESGETLYEKGTAGTEFHVVLSGRLAIEVDGEVVTLVEPGGVVGAMAALVDGGVRTETVRAAEESRVASIAALHLPAAVEHRPAIAVGLIRVLIAQLLSQGEHLTEVRSRAGDVAQGLAQAEHDHAEFARRCRERAREFLPLGLADIVAEAERLRDEMARDHEALARGL